MIRRETDARLINTIANHPSVLPYFDLAKTGALDFSECLERPADYAVVSNGIDALGIFEWSAPGVWQGHTMFLPSCRGRRAAQEGRAICEWALDNLGDMLWGQTPLLLRHVRWFNRQLGFERAGIGFHHVSGEVEFFVMRKSNGRTSDCSRGDLGS